MFHCSAAYIRGWWIWAYWISPVAFTTRSLALNELTTAQWSAPYPYNPSISIGDAVLAPFGIQTGYWWVWLGVGVLAGYAVAFNAIAALAYTFLSCRFCSNDTLAHSQCHCGADLQAHHMARLHITWSASTSHGLPAHHMVRQHITWPACTSHGLPARHMACQLITWPASTSHGQDNMCMKHHAIGQSLHGWQGTVKRQGTSLHLHGHLGEIERGQHAKGFSSRPDSHRRR